MKRAQSAWPFVLSAVLLTSGCAATPAPLASPDPTVRALENQVAALSSQLERVQATALPTSGSTAPTIPETPAQEPEPEPTIEPTSAPTTFPTRAPRVITAADAAPCQLGQIKGNRNSKIYHVPGGGSYSQTKANVQCFASESEAQSAGYRRALN